MKLLGYYLIEPDRKSMIPLSIPSECIYSASDCICDQFPDVSDLWGDEERRDAFAKKMKIDDETLDQLSSLLNSDSYSIAGYYFTNPDAARIFLRLFKQAGYDLQIISLHFRDEDHAKIIDILRKSVNFSFNENSLDNEEGEVIGKDIIGYDWAFFHSWICNCLHQDPYPSQPQFNKFGLLENSWEEVEEFSRICQGQGEPVVWIPCLVKLHPEEIGR